MKKIAIPTIKGVLCPHFGQCEAFVIITIENDSIIREERLEPPLHQPGVYPKWLHELGVTEIIAGGMGQKAKVIFEQNGIQVRLGVEPRPAKQAVEELMLSRLETGENLCDH
ncbi:MAG: NifB/NifX family molybdenum-iron cluster-binding protein [Bacteroidales bacterium]